MNPARVLIPVVVLCLSAAAENAWACACCDGESKITPLGWAKLGRELLLRNEEHRRCERRLQVAVYPIGNKAPSACYDLLGNPQKRVACSRVTADWEKQPVGVFSVDSEAVVSVSALEFFARYVVSPDGAFRKTSIEVFLSGSSTPLAALPAYEYEYTPPGGDGEAEVFPLEVAILPSLDEPERAALLARGMDDDPGFGHRGFLVRWVELPRGTNRAPGVAWVRALPRFKSPNNELPATVAMRANGAGLTALAAGRLEESRARFETAVALEPAHALARYNLVCVLARQGAVAPALQQLVELLTQAPEPVRTERRERARVDPDLESLRSLPKFQELVCGGPCAALPASSIAATVAIVPTAAADSALSNPSAVPLVATEKPTVEPKRAPGDVREPVAASCAVRIGTSGGDWAFVVSLLAVWILRSLKAQRRPASST